MSFIVYDTAKGRKGVRLAAGLRWVVLEGNDKARPSSKKIREQARGMAASRYVLNHKPNSNSARGVQGGENTTIGLYTEPVHPIVKGKLYSLSMLLLVAILRDQQVDLDAVNVALLMEPQGMPHLRVIVFIQSGQVIMDSVVEKERAIKQIEDHVARALPVRVLAQHPEIAGPYTPISWETVVGFVDSKASDALLRSIPRAPHQFVVLAVLGVAASSWVAYDTFVIQPHRKRLAAQALAARDQTPTYLKAALHALQSTGWDRTDLKAFLIAMRERPVIEAGWMLQEMACDVAQCTTKWERRGGLLPGLAAARADETLLSPGTSTSAAAGPPALDTASTQIQHPRQLAAVDPSTLPKVSTAVDDLVTLGQKLSNAGIAVNLREMQPWEVIPISDVDPQSILRKSELEISLMPHQASEVLALLPESTLIQTVHLKVADINSVTLVFKGNSYAR